MNKPAENSNQLSSGSIFNRDKVSRNTRIIIVDDERIMRNFLSDVLKNEGYTAETASSAQNALDKFKERPFDLMITDVKMPGMDGIQLLNMVKKAAPDCMVIVMTGYASVETAVESMKLGAYDYITKPFNIDQIRIVVEKALEKRRLEREANEGKFYRQLSQIDGLTELYNHRHFHQLLESEIARSKRYNHYVSLIMLDIDHFKQYNDLNGHPAGDLALKKVAWIISQSIRNCDLAARYGGEEFAIIVPETEKEKAAIIAHRVRKSVEETEFGCGKQATARLTVSLGLATYPVEASDKNELIAKADQALYKAKISGRNKLISHLQSL